MSESVGIISVDLFLGFGVGGVARRPPFLCTSSLAGGHSSPVCQELSDPLADGVRDIQ